MRTSTRNEIRAYITFSLTADIDTGTRLIDSRLADCMLPHAGRSGFALIYYREGRCSLNGGQVPILGGAGVLYGGVRCPL